MSASSRKLQIGDAVRTDYGHHGGIPRTMTSHIIVARKDGTPSQNGIMFQVEPPVRRAGIDAWIDADWFEPAIAANAKEPT